MTAGSPGVPVEEAVDEFPVAFVGEPGALGGQFDHGARVVRGVDRGEGVGHGRVLDGRFQQGRQDARLGAHAAVDGGDGHVRRPRDVREGDPGVAAGEKSVCALLRMASRVAAAASVRRGEWYGRVVTRAV